MVGATSRLKVQFDLPKSGSQVRLDHLTGRSIMPAPAVQPMSLADIDRYQSHRKQCISRLVTPGLVLIGIGTLLGMLHGPTLPGVVTGLVGFALVIAFGVKLTCPACGKTPINRQTSWNPDTCCNCGTRLKR